MSTTKHTPGPWHIARFDATTVEIRSERGLIVAEVGNTSTEDDANARLIAAAPELLSALQRIADRNLTYLSGKVMGDQISYEDVAAARAAIAKATGETQ